jgi:hypothetical protein
MIRSQRISAKKQVEVSSLLGCDAVLLSKKFLILQRITVPSSSGSNSCGLLDPLKLLDLHIQHCIVSQDT